LKLLVLLFVLGSASLLMRVVDVASDQVIARLDPRERRLSYSVVPLVVRIVKICIFCIAVVFTFSAWGYNTNALLAGVGVGGLAVALAAQRTIENLFGGVSVISDRPVLVGDFCQFGGQVGTVEDIGLRSTRIRTLDRTVVTVPNSQFSTMTLENFSKRDRMWFHPNLHLRRDSEVHQIRGFMDAVKSVLENDSRIDASGVPVRFTRITNDAYQIDLFAYVLTDDYNKFLQIQSELLLHIMEIAHDLKIGFAVPFQESVPPPNDQREGNEADTKVDYLLRTL
jgi:MscS family membrane protein